MIDYYLNTPLKGRIALTDAFHMQEHLRKDKSLYKFVWVQSGSVCLKVDHIPMELSAGELVTFTPLHHVTVEKAEGDYRTLLFNSNFYCIYGHDKEVSCNGFLFNGTSQAMRLRLTEEEAAVLQEIMDKMRNEYQVEDNLQEEMLRILLKRFIITCTRLARVKVGADAGKEKSFDIVRQYYVLVDNHFREKKQVQDYADLLHRSPKTLSNLFSAYRLPSPLHIIHERVEAEAKRLLLYTSKSAKEIAVILGFEDLSAFSRFFKNTTGESISRYRKREKGKN